MSDQTLITVRGEAERTVAPDSVDLRCAMNVIGSSKVEALAQLRAVQQALVTAVAGLGGTPLTVQTRRAPLTWSVGSIGSYDEREHDPTTGRPALTGRVVAHATAVITARRLSGLDDLDQALARVSTVHVHGVEWHVDADNEQWCGVRSDAIDAAIAKGRDYAAALGGAVTRVEHVADSGLLGADHGASRAAYAASAFGRREFDDEGFTTPSLDPVPQVIFAVIEARLVAEVDPLDPA